MRILREPHHKLKPTAIIDVTVHLLYHNIYLYTNERRCRFSEGTPALMRHTGKRGCELLIYDNLRLKSFYTMISCLVRYETYSLHSYSRFPTFPL